MNIEKYIIQKDKTDLLSSLKALNKKIVKAEMEKHELDNIRELKDYIIDSFTWCLELSTSDLNTKKYFQKLVKYENTNTTMCVNLDDVETLWLFIYKKDGKLSYYIPTEIRVIIKDLLNI